jgi:hypothetical protein
MCAAGAGIIESDVKPPVPGNDTRHRFVHVAAIGHVDDDELGLAALRPDFRGGFNTGFFRDVGKDHVRTGPGKRLRGSQADAR